MQRADRSSGASGRAGQEAPQPSRGRVVGLLLCGGRSERMGADKALELVGGSALMEYPLAVLRALADDVILACGPSPRYVELGLPLALDLLPDGGPLAGLAAGLECAQGRGAEWVAVLACDMPHADAPALRALLDHARARELDACLLGLERGSQPTFAVYHVRCAGAARAALRAGERRLVSFHTREVGGRALRVEVLAAAALGVSEQVAANVNTPAQLAESRAALAPGGGR